jgi:hypothetical protein
LFKEMVISKGRSIDDKDMILETSYCGLFETSKSAMAYKMSV